MQLAAQPPLVPAADQSDGRALRLAQPLPGGDLLVSRRTANGVHGIYRMEPESGSMLPVYASPEWHSVQARLLAPRTEPDGRASVVDEKDHTGKLYCLKHGTSDTPEIAGLGKRLRLIDGSAPVARHAHDRRDGDRGDGSFQVEVPANTPFKVQVLDGDGVALRTSEWIWVKNKENRGCIGCHEDGELTPENRIPKALTHAAAQLTLPPEQRRTVDYARDIQPLLEEKCGDGQLPCQRTREVHSSRRGAQQPAGVEPVRPASPRGPGTRSPRAPR